MEKDLGQSNYTAGLSLMLVVANALDATILREFLLCRFAGDTPHVETSLELEKGISLCRENTMQALLIDPKCSENAVSAAIEVSKKPSGPPVILLSDHFQEAFLLEVLPYEQISYLTRSLAPYELIRGLRQAILERNRAFDPSIFEKLTHAKGGWRYQPAEGERSLAKLTAQERVILKLLSTGMSISECATHLSITPSTVDNHRTRLMKKLDLHKAAQLTRFAIKTGLVIL